MIQQQRQQLLQPPQLRQLLYRLIDARRCPRLKSDIGNVKRTFASFDAQRTRDEIREGKRGIDGKSLPDSNPDKDELPHLTLAIQCLCVSKTHCTWVKMEPKWLTEFRRYDFEPGFELRDGFKCRPTVSTTTATTNSLSTTTAGPATCLTMTPPRLAEKCNKAVFIPYRFNVTWAMYLNRTN